MAQEYAPLPRTMGSAWRATDGSGPARRAWLQGRLRDIRWWTVYASALGTLLLSVLAYRHTDATGASQGASASAGAVAAAQPAATAPSFFQGQGGGSGLATTSPGAAQSPVRTSTS